jgi:hypothetical protein
VQGLQELAGLPLRLTQSQEQRTALPVVNRFLMLAGLQGHLIESRCLGIGHQGHVPITSPLRIRHSFV